MIRFFGGKVLALNGNFDITNDEVWIDGNKIVYVGPKKRRRKNLNKLQREKLNFWRNISDDIF